MPFGMHGKRKRGSGVSSALTQRYQDTRLVFPAVSSVPSSKGEWVTEELAPPEQGCPLSTDLKRAPATKTVMGEKILSFPGRTEGLLSGWTKHGMKDELLQGR